MIAILIGTLLFICYIDSLNASWQYDDFGNIVHNTKVHMTQWSWSQLKQSFSAGLPSQIISRPLAYLTFALNHKIGGLNVFGYHLFNLIVHWITSCFLFLFIRDTLTLPVLNGRYEGQEVFIAVTAAALWATHPVQVTAVTYIVQRMASMAGMFYVMVLYFYLKYRTTNRRGYGAAAAICGACAVLTKENTVMIVYALLLYELVLLRGVEGIKPIRIAIWGFALTAIFVMAGLLYTNFSLGQLLDSYEIRPFTPVERLLTQPRVIFFYLSLIAVPSTLRMTLLHDMEISHSLWSPWTTAPAIAGVILVVAALGITSRKYPLIAFCGLFFFLNHLIEASFLNLELIYEHRNYIPSMLLFVPPAIAAVRSIRFFRYRWSFQWMIIGVTLMVLVSNGLTTYQYNRIFRSELTLWDHAVRRSPRLSMAHSNLGNAYWALGDAESAIAEFKTAFSLNRYNNTFHKGVVLYNLGLYASQVEGDYAAASDYFSEAMKRYPQNTRIWYQNALSQIALKRWSAASETVSGANIKWPDNPDFYYLSAVIHLKNGEEQKALEAAEKALAVNSDHGGALMAKAQSYRMLGDYGRAIETWKHFMAVEPNDLHGMSALIELLSLTGQHAEAKLYVKKFSKLKRDVPLDALLDTAAKKQYRFGSHTPERASPHDPYTEVGRNSASGYTCHSSGVVRIECEVSHIGAEDAGSEINLPRHGTGEQGLGKMTVHPADGLGQAGFNGLSPGFFLQVEIPRNRHNSNDAENDDDGDDFKECETGVVEVLFIFKLG
ncbi:MAG: tetratricopeptide repeat protein [Desulfobacteraceae bacterium]